MTVCLVHDRKQRAHSSGLSQRVSLVLVFLQSPHSMRFTLPIMLTFPLPSYLLLPIVGPSTG